MRRAFASLVLGAGLLAGTLTVACWWFQRTVMDPNRVAGVADALFARPELRKQVANEVANQIAGRLGVPPATVASLADTALQRTDVVPIAAGILRDVHARLIGQATGPVVVSPAVAAQILGDQRVAALPPVSFDVPTIGPLDRVRRSLSGTVEAGLVLAVGLILSGFVMHPSKPSALRTVGIWLLAASVLQLALGYLIPVLLVPELWSSPWAGVIAETAKAATTGLVAVLVALAAGGVLCLIVAASWRPVAWAVRH